MTRGLGANLMLLGNRSLALVNLRQRANWNYINSDMSEIILFPAGFIYPLDAIQKQHKKRNILKSDLKINILFLTHEYEPEQQQCDVSHKWRIHCSTSTTTAVLQWRRLKSVISRSRIHWRLQQPPVWTPP